MKKIYQMSFHYPEGLAATQDESGAYHIREDGTSAYTDRFLKSFGFYGGLATVADSLGYFHIDVKGRPVHDKRFIWSGNFQDGLCTVQDNSGFYHVNASGTPIYTRRFSYAGDFRHGIAVVYHAGNAFHINKQGNRLHDGEFLYAEPFHKGIAVVKDKDGFYHIDEYGKPIHNLRLRRAEPFYNHYAFCEDLQGNSIRLLDNGHYTRVSPSTGSITIAEIREHLQSGAHVGLFIRHADRHPIQYNTPDWGNGILLSQAGEQRAFIFGNKLTGYKMNVQTSALQRCQQTGRLILEGAGLNSDTIKISPLLGDPGIYYDQTYEHETELKRDFYGFLRRYFENGIAPGMRALVQASHDLIRYLESVLDADPLAIFISHDLLAACFMEFLGLKKPDRNDWCQYLEGVCLIRSNNTTNFRLFNGFNEVPL